MTNTSSSDFTLLGLLVKGEATGIVFSDLGCFRSGCNCKVGHDILDSGGLSPPHPHVLSAQPSCPHGHPFHRPPTAAETRTISFGGLWHPRSFRYVTMIASELLSLLGLTPSEITQFLMDHKMCSLAACWLLVPVSTTFCEIPAVLKLACADMSLYETRMCICCVLMLLIPISIVSTSYSLVSLTVHRMCSAEGRRKAFTTHSSHLTVVSIFRGAAFYTHVLPPSFHTLEQDEVVSASIPLSHPCSSSAQKVTTSDA
uniref:G-protein coupled receptors family 1 profile domain-containing protein n=1 Tax=Rhinopithecus bieti TaxID=61621 RepID=A0A2K6JZ94_RHIBE